MWAEGRGGRTDKEVAHSSGREAWVLAPPPLHLQYVILLNPCLSFPICEMSQVAYVIPGVPSSPKSR